MTEPNNPHRPDEAGVSGWPSEAGRDPYGQPSNPYQMPAPYSSGLTVRRLHDVNHSGWWVMAPTLCGIASAIMMILALVSAAANDGKPSMALLTIGIVLFVAIFVVNIILLIFVISDSHPEAWKKYDKEPLPVTE